MNSSRCLILLGLLLLTFVVVNSAKDDDKSSNDNFENDGDLKCGYIYDGISRRRDLGRQKAHIPISANWIDFDQRDKGNDEIEYQFAIISEDRLTKTILFSGPEAPTARRCRTDTGLDGKDPDVVDWTTLTFKGKSSTKDSFGAFQIDVDDLKYHTRYYTLFRAQLGDEVIYTNTDGVYITNRSNYDDDDDGDEELLLLLLLLLLIPCCLLILLLVLLLVARGRGDDKYKTVVQRTG